EAALVAATRPRLQPGQEQPEPVGRELVVDELLTVAARPQDVPALTATRRRALLRGHLEVRFESNHWQGFAPFGSGPAPGTESAHYPGPHRPGQHDQDLDRRLLPRRGRHDIAGDHEPRAAGA